MSWICSPWAPCRSLPVGSRVLADAGECVRERDEELDLEVVDERIARLRRQRPRRVDAPTVAVGTTSPTASAPSTASAANDGSDRRGRIRTVLSLGAVNG